jgi:hypothetical protein
MGSSVNCVWIHIYGKKRFFVTTKKDEKRNIGIEREDK